MAKIQKKKKKVLKLDERESLTPTERLKQDARLVYKRLAPLTIGDITLDDEIIDVFARLAAKGRPIATICDYLAIPQQVVADWSSKANMYDLNGEPKTYAICSRFIKAVRRGHSEYFMHTHDNAESYPAGEWQKYFCILERRDAKNWGKNAAEENIEASNTNNSKFL